MVAYFENGLAHFSYATEQVLLDLLASVGYFSTKLYPFVCLLDFIMMLAVCDAIC